MKQLVRTNKPFSKENLTLDFMRRATALGGLHGKPLRFNYNDFEVEERWKGVSESGTSSTFPWNDADTERGFIKVRNGVRINNKTSFDTNILIFEDGTLQGYFKESSNHNYAPNPVQWVNLLLEYEFLELI